jgi:hypothetical protein
LKLSGAWNLILLGLLDMLLLLLRQEILVNALPRILCSKKLLALQHLLLQAELVRIHPLGIGARRDDELPCLL